MAPRQPARLGLAMIACAIVAVLWPGCSLNSHGDQTAAAPDDDAAGGSTLDGGDEPAPGFDAAEELGEEAQDTEPQPEACVPLTCVDLKHDCGDATDGCGGPLDCGACTAPLACHAGRCAAVLFVDAKAAGAADGSSWKNAFKTIDAALAVASPGWQIWVAQGTYVRTNAGQYVLAMTAGVELYGHFKGDEDSTEQRDFTAKTPTVLDGQNLTTVVLGAPDALLDGFAIVNGSATNGGGVSLASTQGMTIANCRIENNQAYNAGGGVFLFSSGLTLRTSVLASNKASTANFGGGMFVQASKVTLDHCLLVGNEAGSGGGLFALQSEVTVTGSVFDSNSAVYSQSGGGAIYLQQVNASLVENSVFIKNAAKFAYAGGIYNHASSPDITNCTFLGNTAGVDAADVFDNMGAVPRITNCILWSSGGVHALWDYQGAGPAQVRYSDVFGGWPGAGNLNTDPTFADPGHGDYSLGPTSACIDAADGDLAPPKDIFGNVRWDDPDHPNTGIGSNPWADMGAYEYQGM